MKLFATFRMFPSTFWSFLEHLVKSPNDAVMSYSKECRPHTLSNAKQKHITGLLIYTATNICLTSYSYRWTNMAVFISSLRLAIKTKNIVCNISIFISYSALVPAVIHIWLSRYRDYHYNINNGRATVCCLKLEGISMLVREHCYIEMKHALGRSKDVHRSIHQDWYDIMNNHAISYNQSSPLVNNIISCNQV